MCSNILIFMQLRGKGRRRGEGQKATFLDDGRHDDDLGTSFGGRSTTTTTGGRKRNSLLLIFLLIFLLIQLSFLLLLGLFAIVVIEIVRFILAITALIGI